MDKRTGWLAELKPGDRVAAARRSFGAKEYWFFTVVHITPAGKIKVEDEAKRPHVFNPAGTHTSASGWTCTNLLQVTPELLAEHDHSVAVNRLSSLLDRSTIDLARVAALPVENLRAITALLEPLRPGKHG